MQGVGWGQAAFSRRDRDPCQPHLTQTGRSRPVYSSQLMCLCSEPVCISAPTQPSMPGLPSPASLPGRSSAPARLSPSPSVSGVLRAQLHGAASLPYLPSEPSPGWEGQLLSHCSCSLPCPFLPAACAGRAALPSRPQQSMGAPGLEHPLHEAQPHGCPVTPARGVRFLPHRPNLPPLGLQNTAQRHPFL